MRRAFTLIELLVVVAIIAVAAALLLPAVAMAKSTARSSVCQSHLRQVFLAVEGYVIDHEGFYPPINLPRPTMSDPKAYVMWSELIMPYALDGQTVSFSSLRTRKNVMRGCPTFVKGKYTDNIGYGLNEKLGQPTSNQTSNWVNHAASGRAVFWQSANIAQPSLRPLLGDSNRYALVIVNPVGHDAEQCDPERHHGVANYLMCDGHVESLGRSVAWARLRRPGEP